MPPRAATRSVAGKGDKIERFRPGRIVPRERSPRDRASFPIVDGRGISASGGGPVSLRFGLDAQGHQLSGQALDPPTLLVKLLPLLVKLLPLLVELLALLVDLACQFQKREERPAI